MGVTYRDENGVEYYDKELTHVIPMKTYHYIAPTGRFFRKLMRRNTVHLRGTCPNCGKDNMKWYKDLPLVNKKTYHSVWYCKKCNKVATKEELQNVQYA